MHITVSINKTNNTSPKQGKLKIDILVQGAKSILEDLFYRSNADLQNINSSSAKIAGQSRSPGQQGHQIFEVEQRRLGRSSLIYQSVSDRLEMPRVE